MTPAQVGSETSVVTPLAHAHAVHLFRRRPTPPGHEDLDPGPATPLVVTRVVGPGADTVRLDALHGCCFGTHLPGAAFESRREQMNGRVVVAHRGDFWVGYALASTLALDDMPGWWFLKLLGVRPADQRRGVGLRVAQDMIDWLQADGARILSAHGSSEGGRRTLARLGFAEDPRFGACLKFGAVGF